MRKVFLVLLAFIGLQVVNAQGFSFIPKAGVNISTLTNSAGSDARVGLNIGLGVEKEVANSFALESGLFYSMQGVKFGDVTVKLDYINIPVLAKYYVTENFSVFAGPQLGVNVNSSTKASFGGISGTVDIDDVVKTFDVALNLGLGYQFEQGLFLSASYSNGLIGVFKSGVLVGQHFDITGEKNSNNIVFSVNVGWKF